MNHDCKQCPFNSRVINSLSHSSLEELNANHIGVSFKKGDGIIKQGNFSTNVAFLKTGLVKVHITGPTHEQIVKLKKAPTFLGLPTTFAEKINQYSVTAISEAEVCFIDVNIFKKLLRNNDKFAFEIIVDLCQYELESFRKCANRTQKQSRGNIAGVLLDFSDNIFDADEFSCPISQAEIGDLVDATRESVSRVLTEFDKDGIIKVRGKNIQILKKNSLELINKNG
ncbi:MAG: Crp/Fnr family transcriptional regulator [Paludibacteraceae bacterium]